MKKFAIYQLPEDNAKIRDLSFLNCDEIAEFSDEFELVGTIDANNINDVFRKGNGMCTEEEFGDVHSFDTMHSVSVGDIILDIEEDRYLVVARFGFEPIDMKEAA